jgi:hypothetical protein
VIFGKPLKSDLERVQDQVAEELPRGYMKGTWLERKLVNRKMRILNSNQRITPIESDSYDFEKLQKFGCHPRSKGEAIVITELKSFEKPNDISDK